MTEFTETELTEIKRDPGALANWSRIPDLVEALRDAWKAAYPRNPSFRTIRDKVVARRWAKRWKRVAKQTMCLPKETRKMIAMEKP